MLPFLFWRVSIGRRRSPPSGAAEVSRGEPGVIPGCARVIPSPVVNRFTVSSSMEPKKINVQAAASHQRLKRTPAHLGTVGY